MPRAILSLLTPLALLAFLVAAPTPAEASPPKLRISVSYVGNALTGKVSSTTKCRSGRKVTVQRGPSWRVLRTVRTSRSGSFRAPVTPGAGEYLVRLVRKKGCVIRGQRIIVRPATLTLAMAADSLSGTLGDPSRVACTRSRTVVVSAPGRPAVSTRTDSAGRYRVPRSATGAPLAKGTTYRAAVAASATCAAATSDPATTAANQPPFAMWARKNAAIVDVPLEFVVDTSWDRDGHIVRYDWDFGDGTSGTGTAPTHTYTAVRSYDVALTATDDEGATRTWTKSLLVSLPPANRAPVVEMTTSTIAGFAPLAVTFGSEESVDWDGQIVDRVWDFGDGEPIHADTVSRTFTEPGTHTVKLTIVDDDGDPSSTSVRIYAWGPAVPGPSGISKVSLGLEGALADNSSSGSTVSADGRYVAFMSWASNLVENDTNGKIDLFLLDRQTGTTTLVSRGAAGMPANGHSTTPIISSDGSTVLFSSEATNLIADAPAPGRNPDTRLFLWDRTTGAMSSASESVGGVTFDEPSPISISRTGRHIAFTGHRYSPSAYVWDRETDELRLVSTLVDGNRVTVDGTSMSDNGRYVTFAAGGATDEIVPGVTDNIRKIYRWDRTTGQTILVSRTPEGRSPDNASWTPRVSNDGSVVYLTSATDIVANDHNGRDDLVRWDAGTGATTRITSRSDGAAAVGGVHTAAISADGRHVAFVSGSSDLVTGDANAQNDVFTWDAETGGLRIITRGRDGLQANGGTYMNRLAMSADGSFVTFDSQSTNLVEDDDETPDIFIWSRAAADVG